MSIDPRDAGPIASWKAVRDAAAEADAPSTTAQWSADRTAIRGRLTGPEWLSLDLDARAARPALDRHRLAEALAERGLDPAAVTAVEVETALTVHLTVGGRHLRLELPAYDLTPVPLAEVEAAARRTPQLVREAAVDGWPEYHELSSPRGDVLLTEIGENLALRFVADNRTRPLTADGEPDFEWRLDSAVWSPDGRQVFARRTDYRSIPPIPVLHFLKDVEEVEYTHPYGKTAAGPLRREYALLDVSTGRRLPVLTDLADGEFVSVMGWRGDEVLIHRFDARATVQALAAIDRADGTCRTLVTEPITLSGAMFFRRTQARRAAIADGHLAARGQLLWPSDRTGWNHWYVVDASAPGDQRQLTQGDFDVEEIVHVDEEAGLVWFMAHADPARPHDAQLCRVALDGNGQRVLSPEPGDHDVVARPDGAAFVDSWSTVAEPPRCVVRDRDGSVLFEVPAPPAPDPAPQVQRREVTVRAADGVTDLHAVVYLPPAYDDDGSFPVVDVIYGGPQLPVRPTHFDQSASSRSFDGHPVLRGRHAHALACLGFVALVVDNTGTPGRGTAFQEAVRHRMGQIEIPDHVAAIRQLAETLPGIDLDRVGITGRSWGGYLVVRAMLTAPDFFAVGVADAPAADHYDHIGHLAFEIMGFPEENPEGYELGSCLRVADRLSGRLLIAHGTNDLSATPSGSMKLIDAFVKQGRLVDQFFFPEGTHHPRGQRLFYLDALIARYLVEHLRPEGVRPQDVPFAGC